MGRLVKTVNMAARSADEDAYLERVIKYIPAETVTAYIGLQAINYDVDAVQKPEDWWYWAFALLLFGSPIYVWRVADKGEPWVLQATLAFFGFLVWSYALHAAGKVSPYHAEGLYIGDLAAALIVLFPFAVGLIIPKSKA